VDEVLKDDFGKACTVILEEGLDPEYVYKYEILASSFEAVSARALLVDL
jgi:hypothetical protein